jgi:phosphoglycolate phosphatase-like HAD superfamily hydrolase
MNEKIKIENIKISSDSVLLFDMDGTLVDTDFANFLSYKNAIQSVINQDIEIVFNPKERLNRTTLRNVVPNLAQSIYEKIIKEKEKNYYEHLSHTKLNQSVVDILLKYYKTNKTVLVTNCREDRALITLDHHNLTDKFYKLLFRKVSQNGNPVNKYKNAILSLNLSTQRVIVIENETQEIEFALIAGIPINNIFKY